MNPAYGNALLTQNLDEDFNGAAPISEWDGLLLDRKISRVELLAELQAEFYGNPNDPSNIGLEMLGLYQAGDYQYARDVLEKGSYAVYDPHLLIALARGAVYLFDDITQGERLLTLALESTGQGIREAWHYCNFLQQQGRSDEAARVALSAKENHSTEEPWFDTLLKITQFANGESWSEDSPQFNGDFYPSAPLIVHSLMGDAVALRLKLEPSKEPPKDSKAGRYSKSIRGLGMARFTEADGNLKLALSKYRRASAKRDVWPVTALAYLRALGRQPTINSKKPLNYFFRLLDMLGIRDYHPVGHAALNKWRKVASWERRHTPGSYEVLKQLFVVFKTFGIHGAADDIMWELEATRSARQHSFR